MGTNDYGPVADLYDIYVPATDDIPFFVTEMQKIDGEVLELMAGTGRVSIPLIAAGVRLTCVDLSPELLAVFDRKLAQRGLQAELVAMDVTRLELHKQFQAVIIPFSSFAHLLTEQEQAEALRRICQHLAPGGTFICTLGNPTLRRRNVDGRLRLFRKYPLGDGEGQLLLWVLENFISEDTHLVAASQFYEEYDEGGVMQRRRLIELHFRLTSREEFERLASAAGFQVEALYGDYAYGEFHEDCSPLMVWILKKA